MVSNNDNRSRELEEQLKNFRHFSLKMNFFRYILLLFIVFIFTQKMNEFRRTTYWNSQASWFNFFISEKLAF